MDKEFVKELTNIEEDFAKWYTDIVLKAELADYTDTKGCIAIKPYGYAIWENIQKYTDDLFKKAGVKNFDKFHNAGYKGLYNGETADDIAKRKGLRYREDILDNMGSDELIANLFRISQTEQKLKKDNVKTEKEANKTHYNIGKNIREVIEKNGGIMPEDLPTPKKSLKQLEKENMNTLKQK